MTTKDEEGNLDRLSALPDSILDSIVSLLPSHSAVATSILSRRWQHFWTTLTSLDLDFDDLINNPTTIPSKQEKNSPEFKSVRLFNFLGSLRKFLRHLPFTRLRTCNIRLLDPVSSRDYLHFAAFIDFWFPQLCSKNPEQLNICINGYESYDPMLSRILRRSLLHIRLTKKQINLPSCLFNCHTIVSLSLGVDITLTLPNDGVINLPRLRKLDLEFRFDSNIQVDVLGIVIKSCPLLEDLVIRYHYIEQSHIIINISSLNLKSLELDTALNRTSKRLKLVIHAPKLDNIIVEGDSVTPKFVEIPKKLLKAQISLPDTPILGKPDEYRTMLSKLFTGISCTRSLLLSGYTLTVLHYIDYALPVSFHNLTHLKLTNLSNQEINWSAPLPVQFVSNLKRIDLSGLNAGNNCIELLVYFLNSSTVLEHLSLSLSHDDYYSHNDNDDYKRSIEYKFCKMLVVLSTKSPNCYIEFSGIYLRNGIRNGQLIHQSDMLVYAKSEVLEDVRQCKEHEKLPVLGASNELLTHQLMISRHLIFHIMKYYIRLLIL